MKLEKSSKVYICCGQYIATTKATSNKKITCPRCNKVLNTSVKFPSILIAKSV